MLKPWPPRRGYGLQGKTRGAVFLNQAGDHAGSATIVVGHQQERGGRIVGDDLRNTERTGVDENLEVRAAAQPVDRVGGAGITLAGGVATIEATSPPAEKPTMPTRSGSMPHSLARLRTSRMAPGRLPEHVSESSTASSAHGRADT